jgi:hypothetical protein
MSLAPARRAESATPTIHAAAASHRIATPLVRVTSRPSGRPTIPRTSVRDQKQLPSDADSYARAESPSREICSTKKNFFGSA